MIIFFYFAALNPLSLNYKLQYFKGLNLWPISITTILPTKTMLRKTKFMGMVTQIY